MLLQEKIFGFAGREFIDFIKKIGKNKVFEIYKKKLEDIKGLNKTADKQAASMANILAADELVNMFLFNEKPLTAEDVKEFLFTKDEIDISERAYDFILGEVAIHNSCFVDMDDKGNQEYAGKTKREFWGGIDINEIYILKNQLEKSLKLEGFSYTKTIKDWAQKGYIIKTNSGKNSHHTSVASIKGNYIKIKKIDREQVEKDKLEEKIKKDIEKQSSMQSTVDIVNNYTGENYEIQDIWGVS